MQLLDWLVAAIAILATAAAIGLLEGFELRWRAVGSSTGSAALLIAPALVGADARPTDQRV